MLSRRERRQFAADMELGRRHPYLYGAGRLVMAAVLAAAALIAVAVGWVVAPHGMLTVARWTGWCLAGAVVAWLFWWIALRRR